MERLCCLLLLILIAGASTTENKTEHDEPHSSVSEESIVQNTEETLVLTKVICTDAHRSAYMSSQYCGMFVENYDDAKYCVEKCKKDHPSDKAERVKQYSKFSECIYTRKKYIKDSYNLNMGHVKADAAKLHDSFAEKFMVDMYRECSHKAKNTTDVMKDKSKATQRRREKLEQLHRPYFMYLHYCVIIYSKKHQCPYFRWGSDKLDVLKKCKKYTKQCKPLMEK